MSAADRRRFNGPEDSHPIRLLNKGKGKLEVLNEETGLRHDGRRPDESRPICRAVAKPYSDPSLYVHKVLKTGLVPQASGSAYIESGSTKIVCAVYGPHPARRDAPFSSHAKLNVEVKFTPFAAQGYRRAPGKETEAPTLAARVSQALLPSLRLDLLPKSAIDLFITILQCDGPIDDISAGITASSVALAEAGVEMFGLVIAACTAYTSCKDAMVSLLDPTYQESAMAQSFLSLACMPAMSTVTNLSLNGAIDRGTTRMALKQLQEQCGQIHAVAAQALLEGQT